jgi:hypothetical protein
VKRPLFWLLLAIGLWGIVHAVGAHQAAPHTWRGAVVLTATGLFLTFWLAMLVLRARRREPVSGRSGMNTADGEAAGSPDRLEQGASTPNRLAEKSSGG